MELLISKGRHEIPIPILIRNHSFSFNYENFIRVYHVYMKAWSPLLGECLLRKNYVTELTSMQSLRYA